MKKFFIHIFFLVFILNFSLKALATSCSTNAQCVGDPDGPTCIGGQCDSCCNAPGITNGSECTDVAASCKFNPDLGTCQDNEETLCPVEQIPEAPVSSASRWMWLVMAGAIAGGAVFLNRRRFRH